LRPAENICDLMRVFARMIEGGLKVYDEPSTVEAEAGTVVVIGPDQVHLRLTPRAAEETSERLLEAAMKARGQRYFTKDS